MINNLEASLILRDMGYSVIPVNEIKHPLVSFIKSGYNRFIAGAELNPTFGKCYGLAILGGAVSGNLLCIDVDLKYDLTGDLMTRLRADITEAIPDFFNRAVVQETVKGGFHLLFKCAMDYEVPGNKKLAMREGTQEELDSDRLNNPKLKSCVRVLIETRGEGGYFCVTPTPGYKLVKGSFGNMGVFSSEEIDVVLAICRSHTQIFSAPSEQRVENKKIMHPGASNEVSTIDDYNNKVDGLELLLSYGWTSTDRFDGRREKLLRPGKTNKREYSGYWNHDTQKLSVFSSSTAFETDSAGRVPTYSAFGIYAVMETNGDVRLAVDRLREQGYGSRTSTFEERSINKRQPMAINNITKEVSDDSEDEFSKFLGSFDNAVGYFSAARNKTLPMGLDSGHDGLDRHIRLKTGQLNMVHGLANVGKSTLIWFFMVLWALRHNWKWVVYTGENDYEFVMRKMMETFVGKPIDDFSDEEFGVAEFFIKKHFSFITNRSVYSYKDLLNITEFLMASDGYQGLLIDPYNALISDPDIAQEVAKLRGTKHDYDYRATTDLRTWVSNTGMTVYLNVHTGTEGARRVNRDPEKPPLMYDVEGGNKFTSRADDFYTVHRNTKDSSAWMFTDLHIDKVKVQETGGRPTPSEAPIRMLYDVQKSRFMFSSELGQSYKRDLIAENTPKWMNVNFGRFTIKADPDNWKPESPEVLEEKVSSVRDTSAMGFARVVLDVTQTPGGSPAIKALGQLSTFEEQLGEEYPY